MVVVSCVLVPHSRLLDLLPVTPTSDRPDDTMLTQAFSSPPDVRVNQAAGRGAKYVYPSTTNIE
jgi:hypothetical protein